jgi:putative DNA primase/helicase
MKIQEETVELLQEYVDTGIKLVPVHATKKHPHFSGWQTTQFSLDQIVAEMEEGHYVGFQMGAVSNWLCAADLDSDYARMVARDHLPHTLSSRKETEELPSHMLFWAVDMEFFTISPLNPEADKGAIVDMKAAARGQGHQIIVPPSKHATKGSYVWEGGWDPTRIARISAEELEMRVRNLAAATLIAEHLPESGLHYFSMALAGYMLRHGMDTDTVERVLVSAWRARGLIKSDGEGLRKNVRDTAQKLSENQPTSGGTTVDDYVPGMAKKLAQALKWTTKPRAFARTDTGNADRMVDMFGSELRWVPEWNKWLVWDGRRWAESAEGPVVKRAQETARSIFRDAECAEDEREQKKIAEWAIRSQSLERLKAMWTLAKADLAVSPDELDTDPMLINVKNGTIDLRTGSLRPHLPQDLITKLAPVEFDPSAQAPRFMKFMKETLVDDELIAFVQRYLGYSLTGLTEERTLAVLYGVGKNGKSTLVELFQDLMGDYSSVANPNAIMHQRFGDAVAQYQLAELKGVRFVSMSETKRGGELEESTVKQITGNDTISARSPYGKPFSYRPQFKLWLSTNHKPEIPDGSEAIWDRMRLIPFNQRFEGKNADPKLPQKLREELPGILTWAVTGCVAWGQNGLGTSAAVERATSAYRSETDVVDRFFDDVCVFGPEYTVSKKGLFEAWENWCYENGEEPGKQTAFTRVMSERGVVKNFKEGKYNGTRLWKGIGLEGSASNPPSESKVPQTQKSCKHVGGESSLGQFSSNSTNFSTDTPHVERFGKNEEKVPQVPQESFTTPTFAGVLGSEESAPDESKPAPDVLTTPKSWSVEGLKINYMPGEK